MTIPGPKTPPDSAEHLRECEFVMEPMLQLVADLAEGSGWSRAIVALALARLAAARIEALDANNEMTLAIRARRQEH
jgi:hypothetical protein